MSHSSRFPPTAQAWYMVAILFLAYTFSGIDRQILTLMVEPVQADLQLTDFEISLLQGLAFSLLFVFVGVPVARLSDRKSRRSIIAVGITFWCCMTVLCGLSKNFWQLFLARMGVGVGEASLSPAAASLIADSFPPARRAMAFSVYHLGYPVGGGLALVIGGAVLDWLSGIDSVTLGPLGDFRSWQLAFIIVGLPGLLVALLMYSFRDPARQEKLRDDESQQLSFAEIGHHIRGSWQAYTAHLSAVAFLGMLAMGTSIWYPTFLIRTYGFSPSDAGYSYGLILGVCGAAGILSGGWLSGLLALRGYGDANLRVMWLAAALKALPLVLGPLMPTAYQALLLMAVATYLGQVSVGVTTAALMEITPNEIRAQMLAVMMLLVNICGLGLGATLIATITDFVFGDPQALRYSISLASAAITPCIIVLLWWGMPHFRLAARRVAGAPSATEEELNLGTQTNEGKKHAQATT
ncbi:MFS transporter [Haliea sp. E1-2-M8]|uniref:spinster family MFS transporter n=1 Tax=Haliea sp. E1-2-M8 TaxID=3064706 RepID=UPI0027178C14|nr:MFS transporter [Haliea sp. E1-2-M8]MDO8863144.1 MFS transporter [Haliea sp. E1-2-M8]